MCRIQIAVYYNISSESKTYLSRTDGDDDDDDDDDNNNICNTIISF